jgi:hypothetical protein
MVSSFVLAADALPASAQGFEDLVEDALRRQQL